jgi:hypothetical protein
VQPDAGMAGEPGMDRRVLVGGVVVADQVQLAARVGAGNLPEESPGIPGGGGAVRSGR